MKTPPFSPLSLSPTHKISNPHPALLFLLEFFFEGRGVEVEGSGWVGLREYWEGGSKKGGF